MNKETEQHLLKISEADKILRVEHIQSLWSGYGTLDRYVLDKGKWQSLIVKNIQLDTNTQHPRDWNTAVSHERKLKSYQVETSWYADYAKYNSASHLYPKCIDAQVSESAILLILEDMDSLGFDKRLSRVRYSDMKLVIDWLASFHAQFMNKTPENLWQVGTYWHLATRQDELDAIDDSKLKSSASAIDAYLSNLKYKTFVHGDAKLANFCFSSDGESVSAVDFQYVGGGCGMKDLAYFVGSCLVEEDCEIYEEQILNDYFEALKKYIAPEFCFSSIEAEWRQAYPVAWADFHRFLKGWSPGHWKINSYSERLTRQVMKQLKK